MWRGLVRVLVVLVAFYVSVLKSSVSTTRELIIYYTEVPNIINFAYNFSSNVMNFVSV